MELSNTQSDDTELPEGGDELTTLVSLDALKDIDREASDHEEPTKPEGEAAGDADGNVQENATPKQFNDLADSLGLELDDLYALELKTNAGEVVTVQDVKNFYDQKDEFTARELELGEQQEKAHAEIRNAQRELTDIIAALPKGTVNETALNRVREKHAARLVEEQRRTLQAIPEWSDDQTRADEIQGMSEFVQGFGLPVDYLRHVSDHRVTVMIRSAWQREQRVQAALKKVRAGTPEPQPKPSKSTARKGAAPLKAPRSSQHAPGEKLAFLTEL